MNNLIEEIPLVRGRIRGAAAAYARRPFICLWRVCVRVCVPVLGYLGIKRTAPKQLIIGPEQYCDVIDSFDQNKRELLQVSAVNEPGLKKIDK